VAALDEAVGAQRADPGPAVLDVIERQVQLVWVTFGAAELAAVRHFTGKAHREPGQHASES
jgi:hypothetical protein